MRKSVSARWDKSDPLVQGSREKNMCLSGGTDPIHGAYFFSALVVMSLALKLSFCLAPVV